MKRDVKWRNVNMKRHKNEPRKLEDERMSVIECCGARWDSKIENCPRCGGDLASSGLSDLLNSHVLDHVDLGCHEMNQSLGIQTMPEGYALMLNSDKTHFYWLRYDGVESCICWDKWAVYRGAKTDAAKRI